MGLVFTNITLTNPVKTELKPLNVKCLVDTGATYLCIPSHIANQLEMSELQKRKVVLANDETKNAAYTGPIKIQFEDRICFVGAMVMGDEILLGAIPMEDMDLVVHPKLFKLSVNPNSPNVAMGYAK